MSGFIEKIIAQETRRTRNFKKRLEIVSRLKSKMFVRALKDLIKDAGGYSIAFVRNTKGNKQECDFPPIKWEWVNQTCNGGYSGDDFAGDVYIQIKPSRFLRISYAQ